VDGEKTSYSLEDLRKEFTVQEVPAHITCLMFNFTNPVTWTGIRLADILAKFEGQFNFASFYSWDTHETKEGDRFFETLPKNYVLDPRTLLAIGMNGGPLPKEHGGPLRLAAPFLQGYKSVKWLTDIRLTTEDEIGYKKLHGFIEFPEFNPPPSA
jgi:DMSO/TMAO reductase YedYZ molybdopterin-dependent catalytic subunit